ncbi:hypothetical protein DB771_24915 [Burkholderia sp. AU29985]|nr:hypothetical protein EGY28_25750 [Burkholderia dolosa]PRE47560.1 hypothetical protein C6P87_18025 [Burkholderia sp. AU12872]PUA74287.1 hypothetical protein DB771_24915 [Burkholderia sp. AU29985]
MGRRRAARAAEPVSSIRHCRRAGRCASDDRPGAGRRLAVRAETKKGSLGCPLVRCRCVATTGCVAKLTSRPCRWRVRRTCS